MNFTYSDPSLIDKDAVRFLVGDTDPEDPLLADEAIEFLLDEESNIYLAAAEAAERIAAKFAREINASAEGQNYQGSQLFQHYTDLADRLRRIAIRQRSKGAKPYAGGLSESEKERDRDDTDLPPLHFGKRMHDAPGTVSGREKVSDNRQQ